MCAEHVCEVCYGHAGHMQLSYKREEATMNGD